MAALIASVLGVAALVWVASRGHRERESEDAARAYFDTHGRWPDEEPPESATAGRRT